MAEVAPGLRGLQATQPVRQGNILLSMPFSHVLAVPREQTAVPSWLSTYIEPFEQQWKVKLPEDLLDLLSGGRASMAAGAHQCQQLVRPPVCLQATQDADKDVTLCSHC
jgi:hypothetical protein